MKMRQIMARTGAAALLLLAASTAQGKQQYVYGPKPEWNRYKALAEAALRAKLPQAERWSIEWPYGYVAGRWRHKGSFYGYMSCGLLRTDLPIEGRMVMQFTAVVDYDAVRIIDISSRESNSLVNTWCGQLIGRGFLPPAGQMEPPQAWEIGQWGMTVRPIADGAYVADVTEDMPARRAGLMPGMVITRANGIGLAGMGSAMQALLESDAAQWTFETASGARFQLQRIP